MDASSSAYHIMSYFLVNEDLARRSTNLISDGGDTVRDLYTGLLDSFQFNIDKYLDSGLASVVKDQLTRKLINSIYMPLVYGKTRHSAREDILKALHFALSQGEAYKVADALYRFWEE